MSADMGQEELFVLKLFMTDSTEQYSLLVHAHVAIQTYFKPKCLATVVADVLFESEVNFGVHSEIRFG